MIRFAFTVLLLCVCSFAVSEVEDASACNAALAKSLLGAGSGCGIVARSPSESDILSVAEIKAIAILPAVDNITSDDASPSLLWGWFADFPDDISFPVPSSSDCPEGKIEYDSPSAAMLSDAVIDYAYGNSQWQLALSTDGPNPAPLLLDGSARRERDFASLFANLSVKLSGKISVEYEYRKNWYAMSCSSFGKYIGCGCEERSESGKRIFEKNVENERIFLVETGRNEILWLTPLLNRRLNGNENAEFLLFARKMPAKITVSVDGREIADADVYSFETSIGECGEKIVSRKFSPKAGSLFINANNESLSPCQLVSRDAAFLPFYAKFGWSEAAGRKEVVISIEDAFSQHGNYSYNFSVREPLPFSGSSNSEYRKGSDSETPAFYPAKENEGKYLKIGALAALVALPLVFGAGRIVSSLKAF